MADPAPALPQTSASAPATPPAKRGFLPAINSPGYYILLALVAIFILGPLGGIAAAYMNFSLGFFVGGQVLAGILGSAVTYGYGPEGKHGANYMQTMAASVASMAAMAALCQCIVWLNMPEPPKIELMLFFGCIGMFGVGIGMLYTPILVDRLKLDYPSGFAVANILRALTDKRLLKRSIGQLGGGTAAGAAFAGLVEKVAVIGKTGISGSTIGAGMIVGTRIAVPGLVMGLIGHLLTPYLVEIGWLDKGKSFRAIGFLMGLAMILGAALVDLTLIGVEAVKRVQSREKSPDKPEEAWKQVRMGRLIAWVVFWGAAVVIVATRVLHQPVGFILFAVALTLIFVFINGISTGISDSNPISSAFVISVMLMSALGLKDPTVGLMAGSILLISCSSGVDMQQDRSTGWRLGTNRIIQFRYQVIGIVMGAVLCVVLADVFMKAYPVLRINTEANPAAGDPRWQSAMTFKFAGALSKLKDMQPHIVKALAIGLGIGFVTEVIRKVLRASARYRDYTTKSKSGFVVGWVLDSILLPSPYAASFGGFVEIVTTAWFAVGGTITSVLNSLPKPKPKPGEATDDLPEDMSTTSLVGGGLIAGEALFALGLGIIGLLSLVK
jgi:uncharacterized oligopeptide transporter (OPT) family protein